MYDFKPPYYGAAYYPESWPHEEVDADLDRLVAHGLNTIRIAEFAWSNMEPEEGKYDFSLMREVVDKCKSRGISVVMCTPSATPPSWMAHKYPEIMMETGNVKAIHGSRRMCCPTNKTYRKFCAGIVEAMAKEFANDENIIGWQLDNEIVTMTKDTGCTCPSCRKAYVEYLRARYGTIEALNDAWEHYTWSMNFSSFEEVDAADGTVSMPPVQKYVWEEFQNASYVDFLNDQAKILKKYTKLPIGTDMMPTPQLDIGGVGQHLNVAQLNHYTGPHWNQFWFDAYRCVFDRPFWITETSANWAGGSTPQGPRPRGYCKANTLASFALGGEMTLYWLFRSHKGGHEMGHGSVIDAWGRDMNTSNEIREISRDLDKLRPMVQGTKMRTSGIAICYPHSPYAMAKYAPMTTMGIKDMTWDTDVQRTVYEPLVRTTNYRPDVISSYNDLSKYKILISYRQYTLDEGDFLDRIMPWVENGGTWIVGPQSDMFTKDLSKYRHSPFGHLENWANVTRKFYMPAPSGNAAWNTDCPLTDIVFDDGTVAHTNHLTYDAFVAGEGVKVIGTYAAGGDEYLEGYAAITETKCGKGRIIMVGAALECDGFLALINRVASEHGIYPITESSSNVCCSILEGDYGEVFTAIDSRGKGDTYVIIPFDSTDILTGKTYSEGEKVELSKFECIFAKKD